MKKGMVLVILMASLYISILPVHGYKVQNSDHIKVSIMTPRIAETTQKTVYVSNGIVDGNIIFYVHSNWIPATDKSTIVGVSSSHKLKKLTSVYAGDTNIKILSYSPGVGEEYNRSVTINYEVRIGTTTIIASSVSVP